MPIPSKETFMLAKNQLEERMSAHKNCKHNEDPFLPPRVLFFENDGVNLEDTLPGQRGQY